MNNKHIFQKGIHLEYSQCFRGLLGENHSQVKRHLNISGRMLISSILFSENLLHRLYFIQLKFEEDEFIDSNL